MNEELLITQCLNGERERDCDYCPASPHNNGQCCFGIRHEYGDPDCQACVLSSECAPLSHGVPQSHSRRIVYPQQRTPNPSSGRQVRHSTQARKSLPILNDMGPQPGEPLLVQQPVQPKPIQLDPQSSLFKRFFQVGAWGAGEGFLELTLNFMRTRRPE